jgi:hypothetical protein
MTLHKYSNNECIEEAQKYSYILPRLLSIEMKHKKADEVSNEAYKYDKWLQQNANETAVNKPCY